MARISVPWYGTKMLTLNESKLVICRFNSIVSKNRSRVSYGNPTMLFSVYGIPTRATMSHCARIFALVMFRLTISLLNFSFPCSSPKEIR
jgi:hypothetical protein